MHVHCTLPEITRPALCRMIDGSLFKVGCICILTSTMFPGLSEPILHAKINNQIILPMLLADILKLLDILLEAYVV